jgi:hypothetical protein
MTRHTLLSIAVGIVALSLVACEDPTLTGDGELNLGAQVGPDQIGSRAEQILFDMSEYLRSADEYSFRADVTYDVMMAEGHMVEYGGVSNVSVRRPDGIHAVYDGDERHTRAYYDGKTFTILNVPLNLYSVIDVPPTIDDAVDYVFDYYGVTVPIADLVYSDPYAILSENIQDGYFVGSSVIDGVPCHHLVFIQETVDWQLWVAEGDRPVPRKVVISYKTEPGEPQYSARLSEWNLQPSFFDDTFQFVAPDGADEIDILPVEPTEEMEVTS